MIGNQPIDLRFLVNMAFVNSVVKPDEAIELLEQFGTDRFKRVAELLGQVHQERFMVTATSVYGANELDEVRIQHMAVTTTLIGLIEGAKAILDGTHELLKDKEDNNSTL